MHRWIISGLAVVVAAGCDEAASNGGLIPEGPPEILQVLVKERIATTDDDGNDVVVLESRLAFGDHPDIDAEADDREVTAAVARDGQRIRVVVDELMRGNYLEEVACADGSWSQVPLGMNYAEVALCSGADLSRCEDLCIGADGPVGILDINGDGAFDDTRLIGDVVVLTCDGVAVPIDLERSYYQPSGGQLISAIGTDSLGPAIVISPEEGMKPGSSCGLTFSSKVVDKDDNEICAPSGGGDCSPGDTSGVGFTIEPFLIATSDPAPGAVDVELLSPESADGIIAVHLNATLDETTIASAVKVSAGGTELETVTPVISPEDDATVLITITGGFQPMTTYTVTVTGGAAGIKDTYADTLAEASTTISFTTKAE